MTTKKQKYYVVWVGHNPGIYNSWASCQTQVKNYPNAIYKSFSSKAEADQAFRETAPHPSFKRKIKEPVTQRTSMPIPDSVSVDAACSGNPGAMEYQGVWTSDKTSIFHFGPVANGTNNIGEFLAIVHALAWLGKRDDLTTPVYSDSRTAIGWVKKKKANTQLKRNANNQQLFEMIMRAEKWLTTNTWKNPLLKWETEAWGENPADFDRK
ncbi:MAG: ribonuclease H family protein [Bacteroidota bacterium]|nr:ribonuclease H family protein [Bacteroidota bacterium]